MDDKIKEAAQAVISAWDDDLIREGKTYKAIKALKEAIEGPKRWVPTANANTLVRVFGDGSTSPGVATVKSTKDYLNVGRAYESREVAEYLRDEYITPQALILRRAEEIYIDLGYRWVADWKNADQRKWYLYYDSINETWKCSSIRNDQDCGTPYMSERAAKQIAKELNSGYIQLKTKGEENG